MPTTSNFGWTTPADTDLVKDGALAIRTLGNGIDTSFLDLKGGTTGQNLRKASNTDLDFTFAGDATNTVIDAEGDLLVGDSADTLQRLAIGTTGQVLTVDTTLDGKVKWAAPAGGGKVLQVVHATTTTVASSATNTYIDTNLTASITPSSTLSKVLVLVSQNGLYKDAVNAANCIALQLLRGATNIAYFGTEMLYQNVADRHVGDGASINWLDSPSTTSSTTYKTQFKSQNNTGTVYVQSGAGGTTVNSTITLMEIGA
jgi:hypothetical protein